MTALRDIFRFKNNLFRDICRYLLNHFLTYQDQNSKYLPQRKKELEKDLHQLLLQNRYQNSVGLKAYMLAKQMGNAGFPDRDQQKNIDFLQALKEN